MKDIAIRNRASLILVLLLMATFILITRGLPKSDRIRVPVQTYDNPSGINFDSFQVAENLEAHLAVIFSPGGSGTRFYVLQPLNGSLAISSGIGRFDQDEECPQSKEEYRDTNIPDWTIDSTICIWVSDHEDIIRLRVEDMDLNSGWVDFIVIRS